MGKVTISDIAKRFKVSTTTISNALNNKPGVGEETRGKIVQFAKEFGYQPNYFAKGLVAKQSFTIGLIVTNFSDPYYHEINLKNLHSTRPQRRYLRTLKYPLRQSFLMNLMFLE